jgi:pimeloyl-ACP methyl ester carboxylesterase
MEASPHAIAACLMAPQDTDLRNDLVKVNVLAVIFHSTQDKIGLVKMAEAMPASIKGAQPIRFENSGHGLFSDSRNPLLVYERSTIPLDDAQGGTGLALSKMSASQPRRL